MVHDDVPVGLDAVEVRFDDRRAVADAGIVVAATLAERLGIEALVDEMVELGERAGAANAGAKVMTLISAMALGADSIDDCDVLRAGRTGAVLGHRVAAPSTLGTFLRAFTFGHVRQLDRVLDRTLERAWRAGAGPGDERLVVDVDSFVGEVHGYAKQGAAYGYTHQRGYHPILASRAGTGEVLHVRLRKGSANTSRGAQRFVDELIARVERAGASGPKLLRADSGFWNKTIFARLAKAGWSYSIGVRLQPTVRAAIEQIPEPAWQTLDDYPPTSEAQIAETTLAGQRLVVRRVRTLDRQGQLLPTWELYPFLTNRTDALEVVEAEHRQHAVVELVHPRSQRPGARALPLRALLRQRRLDGDRRAGPQPAALDRRARLAQPHRPRRAHPAPTPARDPRPTHAQRATLDAAPPRPLALATRLHRSAHPHPSAPRGQLTDPPGPPPPPGRTRRPIGRTALPATHAASAKPTATSPFSTLDSAIALRPRPTPTDSHLKQPIA